MEDKIVSRECGLLEKYFAKQRRDELHKRFPTTAQVQIGDLLRTAETDEDIKGMVCEARGVIACLSDGDRVEIRGGRVNFRKAWGLNKIPVDQWISTTFKHDHEGFGCLVLDGGESIPFNQLNRRIKIRVVSVVEQRHPEVMPEYDDAVVANLLNDQEFVLVGT